MSGKVLPSTRAKILRSKSAKQAAQIYENFTGHSLDSIESFNFPDLPDAVAVIGYCDAIEYTTVRDGKTEKYRHKFKSKDRPVLTTYPDGTQILLIGGNYDFTERGIVDGSDTKTRHEMGID